MIYQVVNIQQTEVQRLKLLWSDLRDYSNAYIVVKGRIIAIGNNDANRSNKKLTFKNNAPFTSCILKIYNTSIDNPENLDIVKPMFNLLQYSDH